RRRWPWGVLAVLLVAAGAGGGAYALVQASIPSFPVPALRDRTVPEAQAEVAGEGFKLSVQREEFSEQVAAGRIIDQDPASGSLKRGRTIGLVVSTGPEPRPVPALAGLDRAQAETALRTAGFEPEVVLQHDEATAKGVVLGWAPTGVQAKGTKVTVTVSDGARPRPVPDLRGLDFASAQAELAKVNLKATRVEVFSDNVESGKVVSTNPPAASAAERDSTVTVNVSKGPDEVTVPDVIGRRPSEAETVLENAGLRPAIFGPNPNRSGARVVLTVPGAGSKARRGAVINVYTT
ncbi:MAG: PASTA domain-containing protein, partial [Acidimicrobiales bacterium]